MKKKTTTETYSVEFGTDFQRHILATMCRIPTFVIRYRSALDARFFASAQHRAVAKALLGFVDEHKLLPQSSTLLETIKPQVAKEDENTYALLLKELYSTDVSDAPAVAQKTVEFGKQQALVGAILSAAERLDKNDRNVRPLIDEALMVGEDLLDVGISYADEVDKRHKWYTEPEVAFDTIRTGITHLDLLLGGGLGRGELGVVLAPPKRGKTTTLINIGFGALLSVMPMTVVHYSGEMKQQRVVQRYDDRIMGNRVKYKRTDPERYVADLKSRVALVPGRLFVKSYPTRSATPSMIRSHLTLLTARGFTPDLVIVDYADILKPERRMGDMRHEQAGIYEDLRQIAGEFNAGVWTGSQAKASALDKEVLSMADFAEAFEKAAIMDAGFAFCQTSDEKLLNRARLFAVGVRNVEDGRTVECEVRRDACLIRSIGLLTSAGTAVGKKGVEAKVAMVKKKKAMAKKPTKELSL